MGSTPRSADALEALLNELQAIVREDQERAAAFASASAEAARIAPGVPWIHRVARAGERQTFRSILRDRRLRVSESCTTLEKDRGHLVTLYLNVGYAAYPKGSMALLFAPQAIPGGRFSPFDSGSLERDCLCRATAPEALERDAQAHFFDSYSGPAEHLARFLGPYLAAHFREPLHYLQRPQTSIPDFPAFHGLVDRKDDRRAWTVEVRLPTDLDLIAGRHQLRRIVLAEQAMVEWLWDVAPELLRITVVWNGKQGDFAGLIASEAEKVLEGDLHELASAR